MNLLYNELIEYRRKTWKKVLSKKITVQDFILGSYNFLEQKTIRPLVRPMDKESILLNYYYWQIQIERKFLLEEELVKLDLGDPALFFNIISLYSKRRDQMIRRLLIDTDLKIKDAYFIFNSIIEIVLSDNQVIYASYENVDRLNRPVTNVKRSIDPIYSSIFRLSL